MATKTGIEAFDKLPPQMGGADVDNLRHLYVKYASMAKAGTLTESQRLGKISVTRRLKQLVKKKHLLTDMRYVPPKKKKGSLTFQ